MARCRYEVAFDATGILTDKVIAELKAVSNSLYVQELWVCTAGATGAITGWVRPSVVGTASTTITGLACDPADPASTALLATAWSTPPTVPATFNIGETIMSSNLIGDYERIVFPPDRPIIVRAGASLCIVNTDSGTSTLNAYGLVWEE